jgi:hypothetical protein
VIRIRFVHGRDPLSHMIELRSGTAMPFCPSHCECVTPEGKYLGQRFDGGMQAREPGYDAKWLEFSRIVDLPCSPAQEKAFYDKANSMIGLSYDWKAIIDFALPVNLHLFDHAICSATMTQLLRACEWFAWPLAVPFHQISPRDLLLMLSSHIQIDH